MMLHFCTLFDSNYLSRGIAMHQSLLILGGDFHLYIVAFDELSYTVLRGMKLEKVTVIALREMEDEKLIQVKPTRTRTEYCWTCTSSVILFCLEKYNLKNCTYVDADLYFYQSPEILINEIPDDFHVMITSHRYTPYYDQSKASGTYCVQFMYFDNSEKARVVLTRWRDQCLEWCYNRVEEGKFGDQKYLDDWTRRYDQVWELKNLGGGLAPWNVQQYRFETLLKGTEIKTGLSFNPVFYHFHGLKFYDQDKTTLAPNTYRISKSVKSLFYAPYLEQLQMAMKRIEQFDSGIRSRGILSRKEYLINKYVKGKVSFFYCNFVKRMFSWYGKNH